MEDSEFDKVYFEPGQRLEYVLTLLLMVLPIAALIALVVYLF